MPAAKKQKTADGATAPAPAGADYVPQNVLITGGAGFIASHVALRFAKRYPRYNVVVVDKLDYCANLNNLREIAALPNFKFVKADVGSADLMTYVMSGRTIDTVMHFAAQTHVDNSFGNSFEFTKNNIAGTHVVLEACQALGDQIERFLHVSTDEVYGEISYELEQPNVDAASLLSPPTRTPRRRRARRCS